MARGRMLDRALARSKKFNTLKRDHRLIYVSILPFLDREGRTRADPLYLKANIFNHSDFTPKELAQGVAAMADAELVWLYGDEDNEALIEYANWLRFNTPNRKEAKSEYVGPSDSAATDCWCELILASRTQDRQLHVQGTGNARAMHVQSTELAPALHVENVNENVNVNVNVNGNEITSTPKPVVFLKIWNDNRGPLSGVERLTTKRKRQLEAFVDDTKGDDQIELFTHATLYVSADPFWLEKGYGFDNLLVQGRIVEKAEKYRTYGTMSAGDRRLANRALQLGATFGGRDA